MCARNMVALARGDVAYMIERKLFDHSYNKIRI